MNVLAKACASLGRRDGAGSSITPTWDVVGIKHGHWTATGLVLSNEILFVDKSFTSFRVAMGNLCFKVIWGKPSPQPLDRNYLTAYFRANNDNPYAVYYTVTNILGGRPTTGLTQFPPLRVVYPSEHDKENALNRLIQLALPGDAVLSRCNGDPISALIRKCDRVPFSHVAPYVGDGRVMDIGTKAEINLLEFTSGASQFALYRDRSVTTDEQRMLRVQHALEMYVRFKGYAYAAVLKIFLRDCCRVPLWKDLRTLQDVLYSGRFDLIAYA